MNSASSTKVVFVRSRGCDGKIVLIQLTKAQFKSHNLRGALFGMDGVVVVVAVLLIRCR